MKLRNLIVWIFVFFAISILGFSQVQEIEWQSKSIANAIVLNASFDEVWNRTISILLFDEFKVKGTVTMSVNHRAILVEKDAGLLLVNGHAFGAKPPKYQLQVFIQPKDGHIKVRIRHGGTWPKRVIEKFFELLKESKEIK